MNRDNYEENLKRAFDLIEEYLFVPQMMAIEDLEARPALEDFLMPSIFS